MKVQSKKDEFVIKLKNTEQTQCVKDYYCPDNNDSWIHFHFAILHDDLGKYSMLYDYLPDRYSNLPVISFEEWQSLPDVPKCEYDPKDVVFKNIRCVSELEEIKPNKIIGYKLIKQPRFDAPHDSIENAVKELLGGFLRRVNGSVYFYESEKFTLRHLKEAGVLDLWFEPVYDESITLKSGTILSEDDIAEVKEILNNK